MSTIQVKIFTPTGFSKAFEVPSKWTATELVERVWSLLNLPTKQYAVKYGPRQLRHDETLSMAEVVSGSELRLILLDGAPSASGTDPYIAEANSGFPALIIYLIDVSGSMSDTMSSRNGPKKRIEVAEENFRKAIQTMNARSMRGDIISPRYRIALYIYSDKVHDVYSGAKSIAEVMKTGIPDISADKATNTKAAFIEAKKLLERELPKMQVGVPGSQDTFPAPLVCHLTDGEFSSGCDPTSVVKEIMNMRVPDGHVLVENIYISDKPVDLPEDLSTWEGFPFSINFPDNPYANKLLSLSSAVPASYAQTMSKKSDYQIGAGTAMLYPGTSVDLVRLAFQVSCATKTEKS